MKDLNRFIAHGSIAGAMLISLAALISFSPAARGKFIWDDDRHVEHNDALRDARGLWRIWSHLDTEPQYYPLTHTSFWIDFQLWKLNTGAYHVENILIHAGVAIALWRLLRRLQLNEHCHPEPHSAKDLASTFKQDASRSITRHDRDANALAFFAALIFAVHPLQVETVAWISERKNLLSALFELFALIVYWPIAMGEWKRSRYIAAIALFLAAMLSKTVACTMPAVILVLIWWKRGRFTWRDVWPTIPMFALAGVFGVITSIQERLHVGARGPDWDLSIGQRGLVAARALWFYAAKLVWPTHLTFSYPRWDVRTNDPIAWGFLLALVAVFLALFSLRQRIGRGPLAAALIFAGVLAPALGFVNTYPMRYSFVADHFQYLASAALITLALASFRAAARNLGERISFGARDSSLPLGMTTLVVVTLALGATTFARCFAFHDAESLWRDTIAKNPESWMAQNNLAGELMQQGKFDEALDHLAIVQTLRPNHPTAPFTRGEVLMKLSRWQEAVDSYRRGLSSSQLPAEVNPAVVHERIAEALSHLGRQDEAHDEQAIATLYRARQLDLQQHDLPAIEAYQNYLQMKPQDAAAHASLGVLYGRADRFADAAREFEAALSIDPGLIAAQRGLSMARTMLRRGSPASQNAR